MRRSSTIVLSALIGTLSLSAKGPTVKITVTGPRLPTPLATTDSRVGDFPVWSGPGVRVGGIEQTEGFIVDWKQGPVQALPDGLERYEVAFYTFCTGWRIGCTAQEPWMVYVVLYAFSPQERQGYVYLPDRGDELFKFNTAMWHGAAFHGKWLRATAAWEIFVRPLIAKGLQAQGTARSPAP